MRRLSRRKRKVRVIEDLGGPLRDKASGTRHVAKKKVKRVHGRVIGERAVRVTAKKRCEHLDAHIERQAEKVCVIDNCLFVECLIVNIIMLCYRLVR